MPGQLTFLVVAVWFFAMLVLGHSGVMAGAGRVGPLQPVQVAIVGPIAAFFALYIVSRAFRRFVAGLDLSFLVALQGCRVLALSHVNMWGYGLMAGGFAFPVGLANLGVGLFAIYLTPIVAQRKSGWRTMVAALSILGLVEFAMTVALAMLGFLGRALPIDPPVAPDGYADFRYPPLSLFPTFAIPFFSLVHFATLLRLCARREETDAVQVPDRRTRRA